MNRFTASVLGSVMAVSLGFISPAMAESIVVNDKIRKIYLSAFDDKGSIKGKVRDERINQDMLQKLCSDVDGSFTGKNGAKKYQDLVNAERKAIQYPDDGKYMGDWKAGEKIAQNGKGLTWKDKLDAVNGGGCYNCHQISKEEVSYGNIGPSLHNYGKIRGSSEQMQKLTWERIWNAKAFSACSWMPRFGALGILTKDQIKDLVALLLDPASPVNK